MPERHIYVLTEDYDEQLLRTLVERGVTLNWWEPMFGLVGGSVPSDEAAEIHSNIREIEWLQAIENERHSDTEEVLIEDTQHAVIKPEFGQHAMGLDQARQFVEEAVPGSGELDYTTAIIDSGIDHRNEHIETVSERINFTTDEELDPVGHGTLVARILEFTAPINKELIDMKVATQSGTREGAVIRALRACIERDVIGANLSLGFSQHDERDICPVCRAAEIAASHGVFITAAAGNHGTSKNPLPTPECPARSDAVLSGGALQTENTPRFSSGAGDVFAPGSWSIYEPRE